MVSPPGLTNNCILVICIKLKSELKLNSICISWFQNIHAMSFIEWITHRHQQRAGAESLACWGFLSAHKGKCYEMVQQGPLDRHLEIKEAKPISPWRCFWSGWACFFPVLKICFMINTGGNAEEKKSVSHLQQIWPTARISITVTAETWPEMNLHPIWNERR